MAFEIKNEDKVENNKQHLNLSTFAYEIVLSDMFTFEEEKLSGFINTVFERYYPIAEASIARTLNYLNGELSKILSDISGDKQTKKRVLDRLLLQKKNDLIKKSESYACGKMLKFWLNKSNLGYLTEPSSECEEDKYYSRRGKYIKSVLEEYARLPYVQRERVYFSPFVESIEYAILEERQLRIVIDTNTIFSVYPYEILCDPLSTANYLVGYCKRYDYLEEDEKQPCSFRISALKSVKAEKSKSAFIKDSDRKQLSRIVASRGVQFMVGNEAEIHVRLTKTGVYKYRRQTHLRPTLVRKKDDVFVFRCTTAQAEFYFFKFGKDAEILMPADLRAKFAKMYEDSSRTYAINKEIESEGIL